MQSLPRTTAPSIGVAAEPGCHLEPFRSSDVHQRLDLRDRPRRRDRGVTMESTQRLDPQVAVDQHQPIGVADHHDRYLLPDLGHRSDQPPALLTVVNPQIAVPKLELVQVHLHAVTLPRLRRHLHLVLRAYPTNSSGSPRRIRYLLPYLVLRVDNQDSSYSRNDHNGFGCHRVLRDIPWTPASAAGRSGGDGGAPPFAASTATCQRRPRS